MDPRSPAAGPVRRRIACTRQPSGRGLAEPAAVGRLRQIRDQHFADVVSRLRVRWNSTVLAQPHLRPRCRPPATRAAFADGPRSGANNSGNAPRRADFPPDRQDPPRRNAPPFAASIALGRSRRAVTRQRIVAGFDSRDRCHQGGIEPVKISRRLEHPRISAGGAALAIADDGPRLAGRHRRGLPGRAARGQERGWRRVPTRAAMMNAQHQCPMDDRPLRHEPAYRPAAKAKMPSVCAVEAKICAIFE